MSTLPPALKKLASLTPGIHAYDAASEAKKDAMHSSGRAFLRSLAEELNLPKGSYDIRSNKGGIAVSGEVTLHSDSLYVQLSESCIGDGAVTVMYRTCTDRNDCVGGTNNFTTAQQLARGAYPGFVASLQVMQSRAAAPKRGLAPV